MFSRHKVNTPHLLLSYNIMEKGYSFQETILNEFTHILLLHEHTHAFTLHITIHNLEGSSKVLTTYRWKASSHHQFNYIGGWVANGLQYPRVVARQFICCFWMLRADLLKRLRGLHNKGIFFILLLLWIRLFVGKFNPAFL